MDISQTVWSEVDDSNNSAAPDGAPEGMAPSGVNNLIRADRGAIKRWYNQTIPILSGGSSTAFTLTYGVAPTALADGQVHLVQFHTACGAAATLNVNGLGAKALYCHGGSSWAAAPIGIFGTDQIVPVSYNVASGAYRLLDLPWRSVQTFSGVSSVNFQNIPAGINNISIRGDMTVRATAPVSGCRPTAPMACSTRAAPITTTS